MSLKSTAAASSPKAISESPLERLPAELRNQIYEIVLVRSWPITVYHNKVTGPYILIDNRVNEAPGLSPGILATNRKLYSHTAPILYGANRFKFYVPSTADIWTRQIGGSCEFLRKVSLENLQLSSWRAPDTAYTQRASAHLRSWLEAMQGAAALECLILPKPSERFGMGRLCKALQPMLRNVKQVRLDRGIDGEVADIVWIGDTFSQCRGFECRLRNQLQVLLRTPDEQDALDGEVLHAAQIMFDDSYES